MPEELLVFYHPDTLSEICSLKAYLAAKGGGADTVDAWIRMVATNRLTGHSPGFFSVYTLPPNQAVTLASQKRINAKRQQTPGYRNVPELILRKSRSLLSRLTQEERDILREAGSRARILTASCENTPALESGSIALAVTSPPFLDTVDYATDNWLRCWFNAIPPDDIPIWKLRKAERWQERMSAVFGELRRVLRQGGHVAFEVGEVRGGKLRLEELIIPAAEAAGLEPVLVLINTQDFTKTANCWGVDNLKKGTNTNRVVLLRKP